MAEKEEKEGVRKKIQRARNVFTRLNKMFRDGPVIKTALSGKIDTNFTKASLGHLLNRNIYNSSTFFNQGFDRMCICLDTKIPVPGVEKGISLKDLIEKYPNGEKFIVYAYNHNEGRVVPVLAHHPRSSGVKNTVKVTFDDGTYLICTPDHPCMMRDGAYADAGELKENDSMMPFYRKNNKIGYPIINTMYNGSKWITEHKLIVEWDTGNKIEKGNIIHHKDFNKFNNNPDNLSVMDAKEHAQYHCDLNSKNKLGVPNPKQTQHMLLNNPCKRDDITFEKIRVVAEENNYCLGSLREHFNTNSETIKKRLYEHGYFTWIDFVLKFKNSIETQAEKIKYNVRKSISYQDIIDNIYKCCSKHELAAILGCSIQSINRRLNANGYTWTEFIKKYPRKDRRYVSGKNGYTNSSWNNVGKDNPMFDHEITFDKITEAYEDNMSVWDLVSKLNSTYYKVLKRIKMEGFSNFMEWSDSFNNHKVVSVKPYGKCEVGDLTVDGYENFATETIIVHNSRYSDFSEMEYYPELNAALNLFADESITYDERGNVLKIITENDKIKSLLETLFYDTLNVEFNAWSWVRSLCKWGDFFLLNMVDPEYGVVGVLPIPVQEVEREEGYDPSSPMAVRYRWATQNKILNNWQITHFRLLGNDTFAPYGTSVLEGARRIYRQLTLLEDAVMVYRIVRSPERRVFKIDVGNIAPDEVPAFMEKIESQIKRDQVVDSSSGRIDLRYNAMSVENDYFIPVRGDMSSEIETLAGGVYTGDVSDIEYFQKKLFAALQIPRAYLGFEDSIGKCLHPDTKIPLLNGVELTIKEIAQIISSGNTQSLWTYSYDKWLNKIVPSKIIAAKQTRQNAELVRVHLDNGKYIDATPDHKFVLRGGESKQAQDLVVGESLQTVNRRMNKMTATSNEYEQVFQPDKGKWEYTHKMVDRLSNGKIIKNGYDNDGRFKGGNIIVVHHKDFNRFNNNPENLQRMKIYEHIKLHSENLHLGWLRPDVVARVKATNRLPENRKKRSEAQKARIRKNPELGMKVLESWMSLTFEERSEICKKAWTPEKKQKRSEQNVEMGLANIMMKAYKKKFPNGRPDLHRENSVVWVERPTFDYVVNFINNYEGDISEINTTPKLAKALGCSFHVFEDAIKTWNWNEVEFLNEHTGFVPGRRKSLRPDYFFEISSNYETKKAFMEANDIGQKALLSLLNHCNISENDWRENYLGSCFNHKVVRVEKLDERVDTYNMEVDDINHHGVHNFYTSAGVVINNSGLAAEDVRWSRSVQRIQRIIVSEFTKLAIIHLYVHGYEGEDLIDFELRLTNPSNIAEQQKLDLWRTRFEIASSIPEGYFDREFVQKNIFQLSNREIAIIKHKRIEDKKADMELESMSLPGEPEVGGAGGGGFGGAGGFGEEEGGLFGGEGGGEEELFGAEDEELPDEEVSGAGGEETVGGGGLFSHKEMTGNILLEEELEKEINSIDDKDDDKDDDKEPRVRDQEYRFKHNRQRIKRDGPSSLEMPDLDNIANLNTVNSRKNRKKEYDTISDLSIGEKAIKKVDFEISSLLSGLSDAMPKKRKTLTENEDE